jgi:hypothetical protein
MAAPIVCMAEQKELARGIAGVEIYGHTAELIEKNC